MADLFPLLEGAGFGALVEDIRANGLRDPIIIHDDGSILDGRNRYRACDKAGVDPKFKTYDGDDALAFVLSANLHRRHLDEGQRATVVSDALPDAMLGGEVISVSVLAQTGGSRDPNRRDYIVKIILDDFDRSLGLKPSMRCRADINLNRVDDTLYIPIQSVFRQGPVAYVWVPDGRGYSQTEIAIGQASELYVEINEGLIEGQVVLMREPEAKEVTSRLDIPKSWSKFSNIPSSASYSMTGSSSPPERTQAPAASDGERPERSWRGRGGGRLTASQMQEMMKNATPEQRAAWEKRIAEGGNRGDDRHPAEESEEKPKEGSTDGT